MSSPPKVVVVGAGISGLATAYSLKKSGAQVTLLEANSWAGGPIESEEIDGFLVENGPHTLLLRSQAVSDLLDEVGLLARAVDAKEVASTRYVLKEGEPIALPGGPQDLLSTSILSTQAKLRLLAEPFFPRFDEEGIDETLASFVTRRLGEEVLDYLVDPFVGGIWAGNPDQLSARYSFPLLKNWEDDGGSLFLGALKKKLGTPSFFKRTDSNGESQRATPSRLLSFPGGMGDLAGAFQKELKEELLLSSPVRKLRKDEDSWRVFYQQGKRRRGIQADAVVLTLPPSELAKVEWEMDSPPVEKVKELSTMAYAPCNLVQFGFRRADVEHPLDGLGLLIPRVEYRNLLGVLFVSSMFPQRAPENTVLLSCFVGGSRQPHLAALEDEEMIEGALLDLEEILGVRGAPVFQRIKRWNRAIPQYEVGHHYYVQRMESLESEQRGLFFAGNFHDSIGLPALLEASLAHGQRISSYLKNLGRTK